MTTRKYSSRSQQSTLTGSVTSGATSITVVSGTGLLGGVTIPSGTTFTLVIDPDTAIEEIVDATAVSTNTFTITRAIDGSSAQDHSAGAVVRHMAIGRDYRDANTHTEADASYNDGSGNAHSMHGIAAGEGVVVGTLKTQTLTNKTLTSPTITDPIITGVLGGASITFEGSTADAHETTLTVVDPTQDNTITLPNTTGTVVIANAVQTLTNKTMGDALNAGGFKITNLATPTDASDAVRKDFADAQVAAAATSAASAATSASSAATSASSASTSASSALTSANSASTSADSAATSAASAAASWDTFDDRYLGPKASAPTVDNDGNPLTAGVIYWNTTDGNMYVWNSTSSSWQVFTTSGDITSVTAGTGLTGGGTTGAVTVALDTSSVYVVPTQTGQSGKYLTTNGTAASWATVDALPSQTGNTGKYLTTNGTTASWSTIVTDPTPSVFMLMGA